MKEGLAYYDFLLRISYALHIPEEEIQSQLSQKGHGLKPTPHQVQGKGLDFSSLFPSEELRTDLIEATPQQALSEYQFHRLSNHRGNLRFWNEDGSVEEFGSAVGQEVAVFVVLP